MPKRRTSNPQQPLGEGITEGGGVTAVTVVTAGTVDTGADTTLIMARIGDTPATDMVTDMAGLLTDSDTTVTGN